MIGYLRGEVLENSEGKMLLTVGSTAGAIGYAVHVPHGPVYEFIRPGQTHELFVHTHVREDALELFGFVTRVEKELFLTMLGVTGIGPKVALGLLSKIEPADFIRAVLDGDKDSLTQLPGIGKKTAERVVLELSDPIRKKVESGIFATPKAGAGAAGAERGVSAKGKPAGNQILLKDAKDALLGLGYREQDVNTLLQRVMSESAEPPKRVEDVIRSALQQLG